MTDRSTPEPWEHDFGESPAQEQEEDPRPSPSGIGSKYLLKPGKIQSRLGLPARIELLAALGRLGGLQQAGEGFGGVFTDDQPFLDRAAFLGLTLGRLGHDPQSGIKKVPPAGFGPARLGSSHPVANRACLPCSTTGACKTTTTQGSPSRAVPTSFPGQRGNGPSSFYSCSTPAPMGPCGQRESPTPFCSLVPSLSRSAYHRLPKAVIERVFKPTLVADHSNTVEGVFSLLKRGVMGTFHSISKKHLPNYLNEFEFRWNTRKVDDGTRVTKAIRRVEGKRLTYRTSVDNPPYLVQARQPDAPFEAWGFVVASNSLPPMPREQLEIHLRYEGQDVDDGSMSLQDAVPVLQGFASAYGKLAAVDDPQSTHRLRITGVRPGSVVFALDVWTFLDHHANVISAAGVIGGAAIGIVAKIIGVIRMKKHVRREPYREHIGQGNNTIIVTNSQNVTIEMPLQVYELFKAGTLDSDLSKVVSPLAEGRIDAAELEARVADGVVLRERIEAPERPYFDTAITVTTTTRETWLTVRLNSVTKSTNRGYLYLLDGTRASYTYKGENPTKLYTLIAHDGPVRIRCVAFLDENLKVASVDIFDLEKVQGELFPADQQDTAGLPDDEL